MTEYEVRRVVDAVDKATNDHTVLGELPGMFEEKYPSDVWALKTAAWVH